MTITLGLAGVCVLGLSSWLLPVLSASLFLFAVHSLTSVLESGYSHPSGLRRQEFIRSHRKVLTTLSVTAFAGALAVSFLLEPLWPIVLGLMLSAFLLYSLPLIRRVYPFRGLRAIPGSRDLMFAGAWSFLLAFMPAYVPRGLETGTVIWAGMLFFLFLGRCLLADLVDLQGDALMGMDTIPIHAGRSRSILLFWMCFTFASLLLAVGIATGYLRPVTIAFVPGLLSLGAGYFLLGSTPFPSELAKRAVADGSLFLAGVVPALVFLAGGARC